MEGSGFSMIKRRHVVVGVLLLFACFPGVLPAQKGHQESARSWCVAPPGVSLDRLDLTEDQRIAVGRIQRTCDGQINALQGKLMSKRLELQALFKDSQADGVSIRARAREVLDLQYECQRMAVDCQIEIREALTPEQLRDWSATGDGCLPWNRRKQP
jgi:Spy/CpxP family protein refolding chaperone